MRTDDTANTHREYSPRTLAPPNERTQPYQLLRAVWTLVPSFAGNQQQDAHEFTRFLLERLRSEFVRGDALAEKARRAASLSLSAGAKDPLRRNVTPRGRSPETRAIERTHVW